MVLSNSMKKPMILALVAFCVLLIIGLIFFLKKPASNTQNNADNTPPELPINTLPIADRPVITLAPAPGRSLALSVSDAPLAGEMEYEMIYNAAGKQEGALGSIFLDSEEQPITKTILLGSKSGGGKITYHEGVSGGSLTIAYEETRLKESWNYLHFDPEDPVMSSTDGRFSLTLPKSALKKDTVITVMKTFGYPKTGLPAETSVKAGPYGYFTETPIKGSVTVELKLPAGEHKNPTLYGWDGKAWQKLTTKLAGDTVSAATTGHIFVVTAE